MILILKELAIVLFISAVMFRLSKPVAVIFMSEEDFKRRRRAWFALTIVAFLSTSFLMLVLLAIPILFITGRKDSNPAAVYLLLMNAIPPVGETLRAGGSTVMDLDTFMLLAICVMAPAAWRIWRRADRPRAPSLLWTDLSLIGYGVLSSFHYLQAQAADLSFYPITFTDSIRRLLSFLMITYVPYFVTSRSNAERRPLLDSIAAFCLGCGVLSAIAIFETLRGWLLYGNIPAQLGVEAGGVYLVRGSSLRAMASSGHPLTLATTLSVACVLCLFLRSQIPSSRARLAVILLPLIGLFVTYSRGPWMGAAVGCLAFVALRPRALSTIFKTAMGVAALGALLSVTPFGQKVINLLPMFGGKVDVGTLTYRERLLERATTIIGEHPFIGDSTALGQLQDMRQGEGIIDLVNVYIQVSLNDGLIGLSLLLGFALLSVAKANAIRMRAKVLDPDKALLGASLIGSVAGLFVTLAGGSLGNSARLYFMLGALIAAYVAASKVALPVASARPASVLHYKR